MQPSVFLTLHHADHVIARSHASRRLARVSQQIGAVLSFSLSCVLIFLVLSAPAQYERLVYALDQWLNGHSIEQGTQRDPFDPSQFLGHQPVFAAIDVPALEDNQLVIPAIGVSAPIVWDVPAVDALAKLQDGVVQVRESYLPGEAGRTFIAGHSSGYWWFRNQWTSVFVLLDKLNDGNYIFLKYQNQTFAYRVVRREIVPPSRVDVIRDERVQLNELALMTCTPIGTSLNRLVVYAEPVPIGSGTGS